MVGNDKNQVGYFADHSHKLLLRYNGPRRKLSVLNWFCLTVLLLNTLSNDTVIGTKLYLEQKPKHCQLTGLHLSRLCRIVKKLVSKMNDYECTLLQYGHNISKQNRKTSWSYSLVHNLPSKMKILLILGKNY